MIENQAATPPAARAELFSVSSGQRLDGLAGNEIPVSFFSPARQKRHIISDPRINDRPQNREDVKARRKSASSETV